MSAAPGSKPRLCVTRRLPEAVERALADAFDVERSADDRQLGVDELAATLRDADAVLCTVSDRFPAGSFATGGGGKPRARVLANFGVGVNHIDLAAARAEGVVVTNTPGVLTEDTADLAILLMLGVLRRAGEGERELRAGRWTGWRPTHLLGARLTGRTLGIVGPGRIGRAVAERAHNGFGMRVLAWGGRGHAGDSASATVGAGAASATFERVGTLDELLRRSDVVSLHCPATPDTHHLIGAPQLAAMQPHAVLINTARGSVVDEGALVEALRQRHIAGAGLDVYEGEPAVHPGLTGREDVMLLPHLGSATRETREAMGMRALDNLLAVFAGREPPDRVA